MYTFDLWMSKCVHDVLIVVVNFLSSKWEAKHVTIKLFEMFDDCGATVVLRSQQLLNKFLLPKRSYIASLPPTSLPSSNFESLLTHHLLLSSFQVDDSMLQNFWSPLMRAHAPLPLSPFQFYINEKK